LRGRRTNSWPDLSSENYIVECKTTAETDFEYIGEQARRYMLVAEQKGKRLMYWFLKRPPQENKQLWDIIHWLESKKAMVKFGEDQ